MSIPKFDYEPTIKNVHGIHIGVVVAIIFVIIWFINPFKVTMGDFGVNGNGASTYLDVSDSEGWVDYQYHSLGATAGALYGESS